MHKLFAIAFVFFTTASWLLAQPKIQLQNVATGFSRPVDIAHCGDSRLFVVEQAGKIWILDSLGNRLPEVFLDIQTRVRSNGNEQGLLGLAFPPDYATSGYFFVNYTRQTDGATRVSRFTRDALDPNKADPNSELFVLTQSQPFANHNGGCIKFGPDGYLYIALGDGGSGGDPQNNGQKKNSWLGKILRIDVSNSNVSQPYTVPADNPFVGDATYLPEIWSLGWRNPWRFSFDRLTGEMWIADVGQGAREEIDFEPANTPGRNYGWRCYEGNAAYNTSGCLGASNYTPPVFDYTHGGGNGCSVTGGFVYRGSKYPDLYGCYVFADYCSGRWWYTRRNPNGTFSTSVLANFSTYQYSSFGEDKDGELYVTLLGSGSIQRVRELCSPFQIELTNIISPVCAQSLSGLLAVGASGGATPITYAWSNGTTESAAVYLNPGTYTVAVTDGNGCVRRDTFAIEQTGPDVPVLAAADTVLCPGQSIELTASNLAVPNTLRWYLDGALFTTTTSSESSFSLSVTQPGIYAVLVVDTVCAPYSSDIEITEETILPPFVGQLGDTVVASAPCEQWLLDGQPIPGASGNTYIAQASGFYECLFTSPNGCVYTPGYQVTVSASFPPDVRHFSLAPNPTKDEVVLTLELERYESITLFLSDVGQKVVYNQSRQGQKLTLPIDLRSLPTGTYFLTIQTGAGRLVRRVVKN